jgi:hypothetical protein
MLSKDITWTDPFTGDVRTKRFYFNLTKAELLMMEKDYPGGMVQYLENIAATADTGKLAELFQGLIKRSYGVRTSEGDFVKTQENYDKFAASEPYSILFMELATDTDAGVGFCNGILPSDLVETVNAKLAQERAAKAAATEG